MRRVTRRTLLIAAVMVFAGCASQRDHVGAAFRLEPGDLLFQDLDAGPLSDAIEKVTQGFDGAKFAHVGMVTRVDGNTVEITEAVSAGVKTTPLSEFLARSADANGHPKVLVGRLRPAYRRLIPEAVHVARGFIGRPYDTAFTMGNDSFYCSELVYESFREANHGKPLFHPRPMTFKDPDSGTTFPAWTTYYHDLGKPIPEGQPGLNPGGISRSPALAIVYAYGIPKGWRGHLSAGSPQRN